MKRVLIAESDWQLLNRIAYPLTEAGYEVYGAQGKEEMQRALEAQLCYHLLIVDIHHPAWTNDVLRHKLQFLRLQQRTALLLIVDAGVALLGTPANAYLKRTFTLFELMDKVHYLLHGL
jgi:DNA-binding response OmpR family regulator